MTAIEIRDLSYRYPNGTLALRNISCLVAEGECVGLIGPNGAGKSSLLLHVNAILPGEGRGASAVRIFDQTVSRENLETIRRTVGLLFQNPDDQLFCPTVFEDVAFGPRQAGMAGKALGEHVRRMLERVGMAGAESKSPHHLSQGEKRRVCLAGVLACNPRILALDEPTISLDPRGRREFRALIGALNATTLIASHDMELAAELCDRVLVLDHGVIVAEGPARAVLADEPLMLAHGLERPLSLK